MFEEPLSYLQALLVRYLDGDTSNDNLPSQREDIVGVSKLTKLHARQFCLYLPSEESRMTAMQELYTQIARAGLRLIVFLENVDHDVVDLLHR